MPAFVKSASDEKKWDRAKVAAEEDAKGERKWRLANYIYHKMKGKRDDTGERT